MQAGLGDGGGAARRRPRHGDRPDGGQPAELTVLSPDGRDDPARWASPRRAGQRVARGRRRRFPGRAARARPAPARRPGAAAVRLRQPAGRVAGVRVERDALVVVAAPGGRLVDGDPPASALVVEIQPRRAARRPASSSCRAPLAEPRLDFRVDRASALAYEVREGEYIQIIDVKGRQCSDFLAFHRAKLERGHRARPRRRDHPHADGRRVPDARACYGKFYDVDMDPLVRGRARHGRAPRHVRARLHAQVLRGHGLSRAHQLHGELQRPGHALRDRRAQGLGGAQLLLQHRLRRGQRAVLGRALVAPRRLRAAARDDRPRVRVVGVPGRHRPGERRGRSPTSTCASTRPRTASRRRSPTA